MVEIPRSEYLLTTDVGEGLEIVFASEGEIIPKEQTGFTKDTFEIWVCDKLDGKPGSEDTQYKWSMNKTSREAVAEKYGRDAKNWIGQTVKVKLVDVNVGGKMMKSIMVVEVK